MYPQGALHRHLQPEFLCGRGYHPGGYQSCLQGRRSPSPASKGSGETGGAAKADHHRIIRSHKIRAFPREEMPFFSIDVPASTAVQWDRWDPPDSRSLLFSSACAASTAPRPYYRTRRNRPEACWPCPSCPWWSCCRGFRRSPWASSAGSGK